MENCNCNECISACLNDPGRLIPDDMSRLSRLLKISERDLENDYLVRVPVTSNVHTAYALAPARKRVGDSSPNLAPLHQVITQRKRDVAYFSTTKTAVRCMKQSPSSAGHIWDAATLFLGSPIEPRQWRNFFISDGNREYLFRSRDLIA